MLLRTSCYTSSISNLSMLRFEYMRATQVSTAAAKSMRTHATSAYFNFNFNSEAAGAPLPVLPHRERLTFLPAPDHLAASTSACASSTSTSTSTWRAVGVLLRRDLPFLLYSWAETYASLNAFPAELLMASPSVMYTSRLNSISFVSLCDMLFVWGKKGRWSASVLAQKAQVGKRAPLSCTSHRTSAVQVH
jgi:hypothetical protein